MLSGGGGGPANPAEAAGAAGASGSSGATASLDAALPDHIRELGYQVIMFMNISTKDLQVRPTG